MLKAVKAILEADVTVSDEDKATVISILSGRRTQTSSNRMPLLLSQCAAAEYLGVSRQTIYRLVKEGVIEPVQVCGYPQYRRADIESLACGVAPKP